MEVGAHIIVIVPLCSSTQSKVGGSNEKQRKHVPIWLKQGLETPRWHHTWLIMLSLHGKWSPFLEGRL